MYTKPENPKIPQQTNLSMWGHGWKINVKPRHLCSVSFLAGVQMNKEPHHLGMCKVHNA